MLGGEGGRGRGYKREVGDIPSANPPRYTIHETPPITLLQLTLVGAGVGDSYVSSLMKSFPFRSLPTTNPTSKILPLGVSY